MTSDEKLQKLRSDLASVRAQRDGIRKTRDEFKTKYHVQERWLSAVADDHLQLWAEHVMPQFDTAIPDKSLVEHIAFKAGVPVHANANLIREGWLNVRQIQTMIAPHVKEAPRSILDFGCGCGRMTRYMRILGAAGETRVTGCDIDAEAIAWSTANLRQTGDFYVSPDNPPLPREEEHDLVIAISVFTHLPETMQDAWLAELMKRVKPGGHLLATFHGPYYERFVPEGLREEFDRRGFVYTDLGKTPTLPDYYLTAFHKHDYVRRHWGTYGEVVEVKETAVQLQDAALIRRPLA